jgi:2-polyprenyl-6-methoxyphenol hydroxylase-like FAD-dependent oxidoreductase
LIEGSYPTWTTAPLPTWQRNGRAVLIGDAAHALQPSSGQGASQALEDSEALARLLAHYLLRLDPPRSSSDSNLKQKPAPGSPVTRVKRALQTFDALRRPRVHAIHEHSRRTGGMKSDMGVVMEWTVYFLIWIVCKS